MKILNLLISKIKSSNLYPFKRKSDVALFIVALLPLGITISWALFSDMSYDEAFSYRAYAKEFGRFLKMNLANNHPLNSILIFYSAYFFPYQEFAIRFPNIVFLVIYLMVSIAITREFKNRYIAFGLLVFYWFLIPDFFSQARGYGIGAGIVLITLYIIKRRDHIPKHIVFTIYSILLATYSYMGLIPVVIAIGIEFVFVDLKLNIAGFIKKNKIHLVIWVVFFLYCLFFLSQVSSEGKPLYRAYNITFLQSVFGSYINSFSSFLKMPSHSSLFLLAMGGLVTIGWLLYKQFKHLKITRIFLISFLLIYIVAKISGKPFPTYRLLLPYYPLTIIALMEILDMLFIKIFRFKPQLILGINILGISLLAYNYFEQFKPYNQHSNYGDRVLNQYKINLQPDNRNWDASVAFYKEKDKFYSVNVRKLLSSKATDSFTINDTLSAKYYRDQNILMLVSEKELNNRHSFIVNLVSEGEKVDIIEFIWEDHLKYRHNKREYFLIETPHVNITNINVSVKK